MKKYIIIICAFLVIEAGIIISFDIVNRIHILNNGIGAYSLEDFDITYENIQGVSKTIDMKTYTGGSTELLKLNDNVSIAIEDIQLSDNAYIIAIKSKGYGDYSYGQILSLENQLDTEINTSEGTFILAIKGVDFDGNERRYSYYLYSKEDISLEAMKNVEIDLVIDDIVVENYYRKENNAVVIYWYSTKHSAAKIVHI